MALLRVIFDAADVARITILCQGCLTELLARMDKGRYVAQPYKASGACEFCTASILTDCQTTL